MKNKKSKKNARAFTLVEVLAVIVILGILSTIGVVTVINIRKNQEKKFDQNQLALFKETAKNYFSDHKSLLPLHTESNFIVYLRDLIEENYIDSLLKYDKSSYDLDRSYVLVTRIGTEFVYEVVLCKEIDASKCTLAAKPENTNKAKFEFINYRKENSNTNLTKINSKYYTNNTTKFDCTITDTDGIKAVIYYLYKNGKKIGIAQTFNPGKDSFNDTITINTNNYDDGKYEIEFTVYDKNDNVSTGKSDAIYIDRVAPKCVTTSNNTGWVKKGGSVTVTGTCSDNTGAIKSGCSKEKISTTYNTDFVGNKFPAANESNSYVYDNAGNKAKCSSVEVKIDTTEPKCGNISVVSGTPGNSGWYKSDLKLKVDCTETSATSSGCSKTTYEKTFTEEGTKTRVITISDKAGNTADCKADFSIDKNKPNCGTASAVGTLGSNGWYKSDVSVTVPCTDSVSKCTQASYTKTASLEGANSVSIQISDKAGNTNTCSNTYYIDKYNPTCGTATLTSGTAGSNGWYKSAVTVSVGCNDANCSQTAFSTTSTVQGKNDLTVTISDKSGRTTTCSAGTYYVDSVNPSCDGWSGTSTSWTNNDRTIKVKCADSTSGCTAASYTVATYTSGTTKKADLSYTISDNAGNSKTCSKSDANIYVDNDPPKFGDTYKKTGITKDDKKWNIFGYYITDTGGSGVKKSTSVFEYCYTGHTSSSCGATCGSGNQYSHKPSSIYGDDQDYYFQDANFDEDNVYPLSGGVLTECITGYKVRANFKICDKAGNCAKKKHVFDWS